MQQIERTAGDLIREVEKYLSETTTDLQELPPENKGALRAVKVTLSMKRDQLDRRLTDIISQRDRLENAESEIENSIECIDSAINCVDEALGE